MSNLFSSQDSKRKDNSKIIFKPREGSSHNYSIFKARLVLEEKVVIIQVIPQYIAEFKNLKKLDPSDNGITDVSALRTLMELKWLELRNNTITDVSALRDLKKLRHLSH